MSARCRLADGPVNKFLLAPFLLLATASAVLRAAQTTPHSVVAHANEQQFWVARTDPINAEFTRVYYRKLGQDDRWLPLVRVQSPVDQMAAQGPIAALLLKDNSWALLYGDGGGVVSGGALPGAARMIALAGSGKGWWAVGIVPGGMAAVPPPTTAPASSPTRAATAPAQPATRSVTQPAATAPALPPALVLFQLVANAWVPVSELPGGVPEVARVALRVFDEVPYVALLDKDAVAVRHLDHGRWVEDLSAGGLPQVAAFDLLGDGLVPRLWVQQQAGPDLLFALDGGKSAPLKLEPPANIPAKDRTIALFGRGIRMIGLADGKLVEQRFSADTGLPDGKPAELALPDVSGLMDLHALHTFIAITALMMVLLGWFRQQAAVAEGPAPTFDDVTLAPIGRRFAAGLIDASPVVLTMIVFLGRHYALPSSVPRSHDFLFLLAYWLSGAVYVLHTTLTETLAGRSLGKIMLGLRVVTLYGQTPTQGALITRNILRLFDLSLFFFPVLFVPFSPLRQRSGDLAAGTLVVTEAPANGGDSNGPAQDDQPANRT